MPSEKPQTLSPPTIVIVVDPDRELLDRVAKFLSKMHPACVIHTTRTATSALSLLGTLGHNPRCLILVDLMMPTMTASTLRDRLRADATGTLGHTVVASAAWHEIEMASTSPRARSRGPASLDSISDLVRVYCERGAMAFED